MRFPEPARSRAVLIGTGKYTILPEVPAVKNNLTAFQEALEDHTGLLRRHCQPVLDPMSLAEFGRPVMAAAEAAEDMLLVYYAGHGLVDATGELFLALPETSQQGLPWLGVPFEFLRRTIQDSPAITKVLILDCCFSGRAIEGLSGTDLVGPGQVRIRGTYTLASSPANMPSFASRHSRFTAFTGALLEVLRAGSPTAGDLLTLHDLYLSLLRIARDEGLPQPQKCGTHTADMLALAPNRQLSRADREPMRLPGVLPDRQGLQALEPVPQLHLVLPDLEATQVIPDSFSLPSMQPPVDGESHTRSIRRREALSTEIGQPAESYRPDLEPPRYLLQPREDVTSLANDDGLFTFRQARSAWFKRPETEEPEAESWNLPGDDGWRTARTVNETPTTEEATTPTGLPRRKPQANLVPGAVVADEHARFDEPIDRDPELLAQNIAGYFKGWRTATDDGWQRVDNAFTELVDETTATGLPKRRPMERLVPGGVEESQEAVSAQKRNPEGIRGLLSAYHRGVQQILTAEDIAKVMFRKPPSGMRGYEELDVDEFLDAVEEDLRKSPGASPSLTNADVRNRHFNRAPVELGYDEDEVVAFLGRVEAEIARRWILSTKT